MQMNGEQHIAAPRRKVWEALNDPEVLRCCIPGCQDLRRDGDNRFVAVAEVKIGPIGARFKGEVTLTDLDPPNGYTIAGSGSGGIAGNARGGAKVRLSDVDGGTLVAYTLEADVGGRMAQLGGPIIDATARSLAGKFFAQFAAIVGGAEAPAVPASAAPAPNAVASEQRQDPDSAARAVSPQSAAAGLNQPPPLWGWIAALAAALATGFLLGANGQKSELVCALVLVVLTAAAGYQAGRHGNAR